MVITVIELLRMHVAEAKQASATDAPTGPVDAAVLAESAVMYRELLERTKMESTKTNDKLPSALWSKVAEALDAAIADTPGASMPSVYWTQASVMQRYVQGIKEHHEFVEAENGGTR